MDNNFITGIKIDFHKDNNMYFENSWDDDIDINILIISLLETINDICKDNGLNTEIQLLKYIQMGSVDQFRDLCTDQIKKYQSKCFEDKGE